MNGKDKATSWVQWGIGLALAILMGLIGYLNSQLGRAQERISVLEAQMAADVERDRATGRSIRDMRLEIRDLRQR